jgi:hypothetical protein
MYAADAEATRAAIKGGLERRVRQLLSGSPIRPAPDRRAGGESSP